MHSYHLITFFIVFIMIIGHVCYMDQTFYRIRKLYIHTPFSNSRDHTVEFLSDMCLHVFHLLKFDCLIRATFHLTGTLCNFRKDRLVVFNLTFIHSSPQVILNDPMDLKIRISSDRRSKMRIIIRRQSKMSVILCRILRLFHRTKCQTADHCLFRCIFHFR